MRTVLIFIMRVVAVGLAAVLTAAGCSSAVPSGAGGQLEVVAAENFYGDIASQLGGSFVHVTSLLSDPRADPHLYEAGTAAAAAVADARLVIENGLGYDTFVDRLIAASPNAARIVVTVADQIGIIGADANPHIWYDVPKLPAIATEIAVGLERAAPSHRTDVEAQLAKFVASLAPLDAVVASIRAKDAGAPVAVTEPVPGYLMDAAGLNVKTPAGFSRAIEEGRDPSPQAVSEMRALFTGRRVRVLLYNRQATSPVTDQLRSLATQNQIPVVPVTELMPARMTFQAWQLAQARALQAALA